MKFAPLSASPITLTGTIKTPLGTPLNNVLLKATSGTSTLTATTPETGAFSFKATENSTLTFAPTKRGETDVTNGISTLDIVQIQRHILGTQPLASPYKIIAADVNNSGSVTTLDMALIRSLILHNTTSFPGNRNWAFVKSDFSFADPANPFPFDSTRTYTKVTELTGQDFIGIKLGDVNDSWDASTARLQTAGNVAFGMQSQQVSKGAEVVVPVTVSDFTDVSGYQFTLTWDPKVLEYVGVENTGVKEAHYGTYSTSQGKLTTAWTEPTGQSLSLPDGTSVFNLRIKAVGNSGSESKVEINSSLTKSLAYNRELAQLNVKSQQAVVRVRELAYALHQNSPNPFSQQGTRIRFSVPQQEEVSIRIYNSLGQLVRTYKATYAAGEHELLWDGKNQQGHRLKSGAYLYRMQAGKYTEVKSAIIL